MNYVKSHLQSFAFLFKERLCTSISFLTLLSTRQVGNGPIVVEAIASVQSDSTKLAFALNRGIAGRKLILLLASKNSFTNTNPNYCNSSTFTNTNINSKPYCVWVIKNN